MTALRIAVQLSPFSATPPAIALASRTPVSAIVVLPSSIQVSSCRPASGNQASLGLGPCENTAQGA